MPATTEHAQLRTQVLDAVEAALRERGHTVERMGDGITRVDGRFVNLWVMYQEGGRRKGQKLPDRLLLRIGYKANVRNIGDADPLAVVSLVQGVEEWMEKVPMDPTYDTAVMPKPDLIAWHQEHVGTEVAANLEDMPIHKLREAVRVAATAPSEGD